jgi:pyruvate/2-oxoglutarate dehydrogenase complex dihydrolipoamide dehydrogenase (E3) component
MSYASVGLTRTTLEKLDEPFKESVVPLNAFTYSHIHHANDGVMAVYTDAENFIVGAEILAPNAEELISTAAMALTGELSAALAKETIIILSQTPEIRWPYNLESSPWYPNTKIIRQSDEMDLNQIFDKIKILLS